MIKVDNAIIMAAGRSSRFAPISYTIPKSLVKVKGEVLIERQIKQLQAAKITDITIVTGYKAEMFAYLKDKYDVKLIHNHQYQTRNNNSSLYLVRHQLKNTYICSSDNYFTVNPFKAEETSAYYACVYQQGPTSEWCVEVDENQVIKAVTVGGQNQYVMMGHVLFDEAFSTTFKRILASVYEDENTYDKLWESIYLEHINQLSLQMRIYQTSDIYEFDSLDELRQFDQDFKIDDPYLNNISSHFNCEIASLCNFKFIDEEHFNFTYHGDVYKYNLDDNSISLVLK